MHGLTLRLQLSAYKQSLIIRQERAKQEARTIWNTLSAKQVFIDAAQEYLKNAPEAFNNQELALMVYFAVETGQTNIDGVLHFLNHDLGIEVSKETVQEHLTSLDKAGYIAGYNISHPASDNIVIKFEPHPKMLSAQKLKGSETIN